MMDNFYKVTHIPTTTTLTIYTAFLTEPQNYVPALQEKLFAQIKQLDSHYQQRSLEISSKALDMDLDL